MLKDVLRKILYAAWPSNLFSPDREITSWVSMKLSELPAGQRILDAGAGPQPYRKFCSHLEYVSQDFAGYDGRGDGLGLQVKGFGYQNLHIVSDICAIPEPDSSFDAILCTEVFEHIPNPEGALREMHRLLKPQGKVIITAPFYSLTHFSPFHFCPGFNRYWWQHWLKEIGFSKVEVRPSGGFFDFLAQLVKITPGISRKYSKRFIHIPLLYFSCFMVILLLSLSKDKEDQSSELACFGYFVSAAK